MGALLAFRGGGRLAYLDVPDADWFMRHPGRQHRIRRPTTTEAKQAACHHGQRPGLVFSTVVRLVGGGIFARRFVVGPVLDGGEDHARETFHHALVAGEAPRPVSDMPEFGGAA